MHDPRSVKKYAVKAEVVCPMLWIPLTEDRLDANTWQELQWRSNAIDE